MNLSTKLKIVAILGGAASILPAAAFAAPDACLTQQGLTTLKGATTAQIIAVGDCQIAMRNTSLDTAYGRVSTMQNLSQSEITSLQSTITTTQGTLSGIKKTLDSETATSSALTDYRSIFGPVRVYALVIPRTYIFASADRAQTVSGLLQTIDTNLIARDAQASSTVQQADAPLLADLATQIANINSGATTAINGVQSLVPDNGNQTVLQQNTAALQAAHAVVVTVHGTDIPAAVNDIKQIRANLKV